MRRRAAPAGPHDRELICHVLPDGNCEHREVPSARAAWAARGRVVTSPRMKGAATAAEALWRRVPLLLLLLAVVVSSVFLGFMLAATDGHFVPQVVDLYLVFQYARAMAEGHPFQYNAGEPPSTGATSLLHTAVLALAHAVGIRGEGLVAFAILTGAALLCVSVVLAFRLGDAPRRPARRSRWPARSSPSAARWAGRSSTERTSRSSWCSPCGCCARSPTRGRRAASRGLAACGVLLALARPEGLPIAPAWSRCAGRSDRDAGGAEGRARGVGAGRRRARRARALPRASPAPGSGTSVADKSLLASYGSRTAWRSPPSTASTWCAACCSASSPRRRRSGSAAAGRRSPSRRSACCWSLTTLATAPDRAAAARLGGQRGASSSRWSHPTCSWAPLQPLPAVGLPGPAGAGGGGPAPPVRPAHAGRPAARPRPLRGGAALLVLLGALSTLRFAVLYGEMAGDVYRRDLAAAAWISKNLPPGVAIANLATSVEYLTGHRSLNLHGVTSPAFFGNRAAEREAGVVEALAPHARGRAAAVPDDDRVRPRGLAHAAGAGVGRRRSSAPRASPTRSRSTA